MLEPSATPKTANRAAATASASAPAAPGAAAAPLSSNRWILVPTLFFAATSAALIILLFEMRAVQQHAQNFVKSHARVAQLEEHLSTTVRVAAATANPGLRAAHRATEEDVAAVLRDADESARALGLSDYLAIRAKEQESASGSGMALAHHEREVFELLASGRPAYARAVAEGPEYTAAREQYAADAVRLTGVVESLVHRQLTYRYGAVLGLFVVMALGAALTAKAIHSRVRRQRDQILTLMQSTALARDDAEVASRAKGAFLATMSHEIRTPLTAIAGFADVLLDPNGVKDERLSAAATIRRNAQHLLTIINDILDMSKIEAGKLDVEAIPCSPAQILQDVEQLLAAKAREKQLAFDCVASGALPAKIVSDPTRVKQALINLVSNAIKFTQKGGVRMLVECDARAQRLTIRVQDDGIGMSREQILRLFNPFTQADNSMTRRFGGTGLGLFITKNITERLGGTLALDSAPGRGSIFTLTLPTGPLEGVEWVPMQRREAPALLPVDAAPMPASTAAPASGSQPTSGPLQGTILLVEDGPDNQRLISMILRKQGATVEVAENGEVGLHKALEAWRSGKPFDLILMDMQMPVMDGYTAAGELRNQKYPLQVVALTAHALKGEQQQCIDAGCDACLTKPIDKPVFLREVAARMRQPSTWQPPAPLPRDDDNQHAARVAA
jgi:signal transduction histidine kinase/CheY-like chemotaxis protein